VPRRSYSEDPALAGQLFELLGGWIDGLAPDHPRCALLREAFAHSSTPFVHEHGGRAVAHVGVVERSLVILGERHTLGGLHAVYTDPAQRRRGLFRELVREALEHCDARYPAALLATDSPELYRPFGFRALREHCFELAAEAPASGSSSLRELDPTRAADRALLERLLATREPVSERLGVASADAVFALSSAGKLLHYCEPLDAALVLRQELDALHLEDIVAPRLPALGSLLAALPRPRRRVCLHFAPDRLAPAARARPRAAPDVLMVRGPFACAQLELPFALAPTART
jgi:GNAT superfamily N-acetyltransferase